MLDLDLTLAILHHVFVFALFGVLFAEFVVVRRGIDAAGAARVVAIDAWYGVLAALILIVGFSRAIFTAKGWESYSSGPRSGHSWWVPLLPRWAPGYSSGSSVHPAVTTRTGCSWE